jgi:hypothetical protein
MTMTKNNRLSDEFQPFLMGTTKTQDPEVDLWIAVLNQAVRDTRALVRTVKRNPGIWANPLFRTDVHNLTRYFQKQSMEPGGFGFICDLMEVNSEQAFQRIDELYLRYLNPVTKRPTQITRIFLAI